jgi:hypothetical protein
MLNAQAIKDAISLHGTNCHRNRLIVGGVPTWLVQSLDGTAWELSPVAAIKIRPVVFDIIKAGTCVDGLIHTAAGLVYQVAPLEVAGIGTCAELAAPASAMPEPGDA